MTATPSATSNLPTAPVAKSKEAPPAPSLRDGLARGLSLLALAAALGAGGYGWWLERNRPPPPESVTPQALAQLQQQVTELAATVANLKNAPPPPTPVSETPAPVTESAAPAAVSDASHNALNEIAVLRERMNTMQQQVEIARAAQQDIAQLRNDIAVANTAISGMRSHVQRMTDTAQQAAAAETTSRATLIAFMQLRAAAEKAAPFVSELQILCGATQTLPAVVRECVQLENPAHAGVATLPMLQSRFNVMAEAAEQQAAMAEAKSWTDRLKASFDEVVKIRKAGEVGETPTPRLIYEAKAELQRGNISGAIAKAEAMPPAAQQELQEWLLDARARVALDAALARIGAQLGPQAQAEALKSADQQAAPPTAPEAVPSSSEPASLP